ncbi:MAG: ketol-acid reductoisomerase [Lentisphaerae bacterium]|jgi:ketol-acid reductoisomerase|nr:ketol-acid reductoisomerase [Lentisphaerota bacterium]
MKIKFGKVAEEITTRKEFPLKKAQQVLKGKTVAVLGYGIQGPGQALNMRDNGIKVIVGQRKSAKANSSWKRAIKDGWVEGKTLFSLEEAAEKGDIIMMLVSDGSVGQVWKRIEKFVTPGKYLYFSHGFGYVYNKLTGIKPRKGVGIVMVAPKGSGTSVRRNFLSGAGINSSFAFIPNGMPKKEVEAVTKAIGIAVGSGYLFPTTFENEVTSDLVGERGILMGALAGVMEAQFYTLRANGHSPSEAFNETCEELTQSLIRLVDENGMDWMYGNCSQTAQHGALKWRPLFRKATEPVFKKLYKSVKTMKEAKEVIRDTGCADYKEKMAAKLQDMHDSEMWQAGAAVRSLRPHEAAKGNAASAGWGGRKIVK